MKILSSILPPFVNPACVSFSFLFSSRCSSISFFARDMNYATYLLRLLVLILLQLFFFTFFFILVLDFFHFGGFCLISSFF